MINESLKPMIRQLRNVKDQGIREALCDSLLEMCDEMIARGKNDSKNKNENDNVRL